MHLIKPPRRIGIIGGMGPEATVLLMSRIIKATKAKDDADHIPMYVDNNPQIPSRIKALIEGSGENPGPVIAKMAKGLETMGAQVLAMPCNTAHHFADDIRQATSIPFLDMISLSMQHLSAAGLAGKKIAMLASPASRMTGVFSKAATENNINLQFLDDDSALLRLIRHVKSAGPDAEAQVLMHNISSQMQLNGAEALLIACSELSLLAHAVPKKIICVDTVDVLANACVEYASGQIGGHANINAA